MARTQSTQRQLLVTLRGHECDYCGEGELVVDRYKGNRAVVCDECGTPGAQVW